MYSPFGAPRPGITLKPPHATLRHRASPSAARVGSARLARRLPAPAALPTGRGPLRRRRQPVRAAASRARAHSHDPWPRSHCRTPQDMRARRTRAYTRTHPGARRA
eukprot:452303-Prymnesium_polylepis.3